MPRPNKLSSHPYLVFTLLGLNLCWVVIQPVNAEQPPFDYCTGIFQSQTDLIESLAAHELADQATAEQSHQVEHELHCLALNIYFEARSEPEQGQRAVGHVVMNRVADRHYPNTVCEVVQQGGEARRHRCQFSWWCDGRSDKPLNQMAWRNALRLADAIYYGESTDPTQGALWYHADYVNPDWSDSLTQVKKIGQHRFYLDKKQPEYALN